MTRILAPRDLDNKGQALFRDFLAQLRRQNTWEDTDAELLGNCVRFYQIARHAMKRILDREKEEAGTGWTSLGAQRQLVQHPDVKTWREALRDANGLAVELLLTPKARKSADVQSGKPSDGKFGNLG